MNVSHEWKIPEGATVHIKEVLCPICHLLINDNPIMMFLENGGVVPAHKSCITNQKTIDSINIKVFPVHDYTNYPLTFDGGL